MLVGLTGGIGSGKSAAASRLEAQGADVIDADQISHELTGVGGPALPALRQAFGDQAITRDGALDRAWMRSQAFTQPAVREQLNALLHPMIRAECEARLAAGRGVYRVLVVPLMVESGHWLGRLDRLLLIDCTEEMQILRVKARSGLDESVTRSIMAQQATRQQRRAAADDVIMNDGSLADLHAQVDALHTRYLWMTQTTKR